ncbi:hypothetical protein XENORESO_015388, partial [Xenotaenia resolanae]
SAFSERYFGWPSTEESRYHVSCFVLIIILVLITVFPSRDSLSLEFELQMPTLSPCRFKKTNKLES